MEPKPILLTAELKTKLLKVKWVASDAGMEDADDMGDVRRLVDQLAEAVENLCDALLEQVAP